MRINTSKKAEVTKINSGNITNKNNYALIRY